MGFIILSNCNNCNYKPNRISIGGGRMNHRTYNGAPAWNKETDEIEQVNLYDKLEEKYIPYNNKKMFKKDRKVSLHQWGDCYYSSKNNFCPKCKTFNVDFKCGDLFD